MRRDKLEILKMSLWKVFNASQVVRQVSSAELPAGSFVWGKEGFKWISGNSSSQGSQKHPWEQQQQAVEQHHETEHSEDAGHHQPRAAMGNF